MRRKIIRGWPTPSEHLAFVMGVVPGVACVSDVAARDHDGDGDGDGDENSGAEHASWCRTLALTRAYVRRAFFIDDLRIPPHALVPAAGGRAAYVRFVMQLMLLSSRRRARTPANERVPPWPVHALGRDVVGLDIGTGHSAIYSLIAASLYGWRTTAVDVDESSVESAKANAGRNEHVKDLVDVRLVRHDVPMLDAVHSPVDFCMCNPPFFEDGVDANGSHGHLPGSAGAPHTPLGMGRQHELCASGGDTAFALRLAAESRQRPADVYWFTTLLGRKVAYRALVSNLETERPKPNVVRTCTIQPGNGRNATTRWVVAWSFVAPPSSRTTPLCRIGVEGAVDWPADVAGHRDEAREAIGEDNNADAADADGRASKRQKQVQ